MAWNNLGSPTTGIELWGTESQRKIEEGEWVGAAGATDAPHPTQVLPCWAFFLARVQGSGNWVWLHPCLSLATHGQDTGGKQVGHKGDPWPWERTGGPAVPSTPLRWPPWHSPPDPGAARSCPQALFARAPSGGELSRELCCMCEGNRNPAGASWMLLAGCWPSYS